MQLYSLAVVALSLTARTCQSEILVGTSKPDELASKVIEDLVEIVTSCYKGIDGIGLVGNFPDSLYTALSVQHLIPVSLIDDTVTTTNGVRIYKAPIQFRRKLKLFILQGNDWMDFNRVVTQIIVHTIWWDHMAAFFVIDESGECRLSKAYVLLGWFRDMINFRVICRFRVGSTAIFNYNPFTSQAPKPWKVEAINNGKRGHPLTVFYLLYKKNDSICAILDFDKTTDLGGHRILVEGNSISSHEFDHPKDKFGAYSFWVVNENILATIFRILNARPTLQNREYQHDVPTSDIHKRTASIHGSWDGIFYGLTTYPHEQIKSVIVTQFRGYKSQLNKILSVVDVDSRYGILIVYLITALFLKIFVHQDLIPALLNLVRITCSMGFENIPIRTSSRIYVISLMIFVVTMQGIFQGNLASLLTQNIPVENVRNMQNLARTGVSKVYGYPHCRMYVTDPKLKDSYVETEFPTQCLQLVNEDSSAACICYAQGNVLDLVNKYNLHMTKEPVTVEHIAFKIRQNWPLEQTVNAIIARMVESSTLEPWKVKCSPINLEEYGIDRMINTDVIKVMEFHELRFAFVILGIGLVCSTLAFILELHFGIGYSMTIRTESRRNQNFPTKLVRFKIDNQSRKITQYPCQREITVRHTSLEIATRETIGTQQTVDTLEEVCV